MLLPFYDFIIDENEDAVVMDFNSFVDNPAHGKRMIAFNKDQKIRYSFNEDEQEVMGVLISADTPIYRRDNTMGEFYGIFRKDVIKSIQHRIMRQGLIHNLNTDHNPKSVVKGAFMTSIFQVDAKKGIQVPEPLKDQNLQDGSLIGIYKVTDAKVWSDIKSGKFTGFSIEAFLDVKQANVKKANMSKQPKTLLQKFMAKFSDEEVQETQTFAQGTTADGVVVMWEGELAEGTPLMMEVDGAQTPAPEGSYEITLEDGTQKLVGVDASGLISTVEDVQAMDDEAILDQVAEVMANQFKVFKTEFDALKAENTALKARVEAIETEKPSKFNSNRKPITKTDSVPLWKKP